MVKTEGISIEYAPVPKVAPETVNNASIKDIWYSGMVILGSIINPAPAKSISMNDNISKPEGLIFSCGIHWLARAVSSTITIKK